MAEVLTQYELLLQNRGKEYIYDCQPGISVIELTRTCNLGAGIKKWRILMGLNFSEYDTIRFECANEILELPTQKKSGTKPTGLHSQQN